MASQLTNLIVTGSCKALTPPSAPEDVMRQGDMASMLSYYATTEQLQNSENGSYSSVDTNHYRVSAKEVGPDWDGVDLLVEDGVGVCTYDSGIKQLRVPIDAGTSTAQDAINLINDQGQFTATLLDGSTGTEIAEQTELWTAGGFYGRHDEATGGETNSAEVSVDENQQVTVDVKVADSSLEVVEGGLKCKYGTGADQPAAGNHTHANDHVAATADNAGRTVALTVLTGQVFYGDVVLNGVNSGLSTSSSGLSINWSLVASVTNLSTVSSAVDALDTRVEALEEAPAANTFASSTTVTVAEDAGVVTHSVETGYGLKEKSGGGIEVDAEAVAAIGHTHAEYLDVSDTVPLPVYDTASGAPSPVGKAGHLIYLNHGGTGSVPCIAVSNGTSWMQVLYTVVAI